MKSRRALITFIFDKVCVLSMKGITETSSGNLISLISSDLFAVERGVSYFPIIVAAPFVNILAFYFLFDKIGWKYTVIILVF